MIVIVIYHPGHQNVCQDGGGQQCQFWRIILDGLGRNWFGFGGIVWKNNHWFILDVLGGDSVGFGANQTCSIFLHLYLFFNSDPDLQNNHPFDLLSCGTCSLWIFWMVQCYLTEELAQFLTGTQEEKLDQV